MFDSWCEWEAKCFLVDLWTLGPLLTGAGELRFFFFQRHQKVKKRTPPPHPSHNCCYVGQKRLLVNVRDWWRAPGRAYSACTSQQCEPSLPLYICCKVPLSWARRSLNDLQISFTCQKFKSSRNHGSMMVPFFFDSFFPSVFLLANRVKTTEKRNWCKVIGSTSVVYLMLSNKWVVTRT